MRSCSGLSGRLRKELSHRFAKSKRPLAMWFSSSRPSMVHAAVSQNRYKSCQPCAYERNGFKVSVAFPSGSQQYRYVSMNKDVEPDKEGTGTIHPTGESGDEQVISPEDIELAIGAARESSPSDHDDMLTNLPGATSGGKKLAIIFTCTVCNTRSAKQFTDQAYQNGVVLVRCPGCENLHLIADRLGMFEDKGEDGKGWDIEKAMARMGEDVVAVTNDNVLEVTMKDVLGDKLDEAVVESKNKKVS